MLTVVRGLNANAIIVSNCQQQVKDCNFNILLKLKNKRMLRLLN